MDQSNLHMPKMSDTSLEDMENRISTLKDQRYSSGTRHSSVTRNFSTYGEQSSFSSDNEEEDEYSWDISANDAKKQRVIECKWGGYALHISLWEEIHAPVVKIRYMEEIELDTMEYCGILSDRMVGACSSFLTRNPETGLYVLSKCELMKMNLTDISILYYHRFLQYIDLAYNNISDLTPLGGVAYLMYLNASHNKLTDVLRFTPPWYLTYVNLAHNQITEIDDLSEFWSIVRLDLSHNAIENITGLHNLRHLQYLNLSYNLIVCVENLDNLNIHELNLEYNCISEFKSSEPQNGITTLPNLRIIILGHNKLNTLEFFEGAYGLRLIDLKYNKIVDLLEVSHLKSLVYEVDFRGNPCTKWPNYRDVLLFSMPSVMYVDGAGVSIAEKVSASTMFAPSVDLLAARSITKLILLEQLTFADIDMHITPYDQSSPPLVILSGPPAVKKAALARKIAGSLPNRVKYCPSHTTREMSENDLIDKNYYFVSREEFNEMARRGEFLCIEELLGNSYGFHVSEIAALALERKIGITHMDLNATIQMQGRYVNAKLVLVTTNDEETHRQWIKEKFEIFTWIKDSVENLLAVKVGRRDRNPVDSVESMSSKMDFINEILNEVIEGLDLPLFSMTVRPQGTGATATDIIVESQTLLPKMTKTISQVEMEEKKHISFRGEDEDYVVAPTSPQHSDSPSTKHLGLKIILDEKSNIIIDDVAAKRKRERAKVLFRHSAMEVGTEIPDEEFGESLSSDEADTQRARVHVPPERLEDIYVDVVMSTRETYIQQHLSQPGFFSLVVLTDDFFTAYNSLIDFIYEFYINQPFRKPLFHPENEKMMQMMIPKKIKSIINQLKENFSTSKQQQKIVMRERGMTSWKEPMPSRLSQNARDIITNAEAKLNERTSSVDSTES